MLITHATQYEKKRRTNHQTDGKRKRNREQIKRLVINNKHYKYYEHKGRKENRQMKGRQEMEASSLEKVDTQAIEIAEGNQATSYSTKRSFGTAKYRPALPGSEINNKHFEKVSENSSETHAKREIPQVADFQKSTSERFLLPVPGFFLK